jgi:hypothetical protein
VREITDLHIHQLRLPICQGKLSDLLNTHFNCSKQVLAIVLSQQKQQNCYKQVLPNYGLIMTKAANLLVH